MDLPERIAAGCRHLGIEQQELAEKIGISKQYLSLIKLGKVKGDKHIPSIADIFGCTTEWLLTGKGPSPAWVISSAPVITTNEREVPVLGSVAAGDGAIHGIIDGTPLPPYRWRKGLAMVQLHGDSAYPVIFPGQWAVIDPERPIRDNNLVVVVLEDGHALVKRWCVAPGAPGGGVWASVNAGMSSPWIEPTRIRYRWPVVGVMFE